MFRKALLKSMATTAAVGAAMAGAALAAPATTVASDLAPMSCVSYQHDIITNTVLSLKRSSAEYGTRNVAYVTVTSDTQQVPQGRVRISTPTDSWTVSLDANGYASHRLSRWLRPGTYDVTARYFPACHSHFQGSRSGLEPYTVRRAHTNVIHLNARNISRGQHPRVSLDVVSRTGVRVYGRVKIELFHHSRLRRSKVVRLDHGSAVAWFARVRARGSWHVTAYYLGTRAFRRSQDDTSFWVSR